jgi:hypothetical protein
VSRSPNRQRRRSRLARSNRGHWIGSWPSSCWSRPARAPDHQHTPQTEDQSGHAHHNGARATTWGAAAQATLHCLTGCAIGEVLGMVIGTALGLHNAATVVLSIVLAFAFGYGLTMRGVLRAGVDVRTAFKVALAADTASIAIMELLDNTFIVAVPSAMNAGLTSMLFWASLAASLVVAFLLTTPANRWMIARGKGHAVVHQYHHAH